MSRGLLVVMTGPSGVGKTTLSRRVMHQLPEVVFSISHTTRPPRRGERDGVDYHFVSRQRFEELLGLGGFLEHAEVHGNLYGTHGDAVAEQVAAGRIVLLDIDVQGAEQVRRSGRDAVFLFVLPPSAEELARRLRGRATDSAEVIAGRLRRAVAEMDEAWRFDYLVVNEDLALAQEEFVAILRAEVIKRQGRDRCRRVGVAEGPEPGTG